LVPHGKYLNGLHLRGCSLGPKSCAWTKVLRRRRFELLSGPLCLTSDAVQRDTSGVEPPNVSGVTPHSKDPLCTESGTSNFGSDP